MHRISSIEDIDRVQTISEVVASIIFNYQEVASDISIERWIKWLMMKSIKRLEKDRTMYHEKKIWRIYERDKNYYEKINCRD